MRVAELATVGIIVCGKQQASKTDSEKNLPGRANERTQCGKRLYAATMELIMLTSDENLKENILSELNWEPAVTEAEIGVTVKNGAVTLTGTVPSYLEKIAAKRAARRVAGVRAIADEIEVHLPCETMATDEEIAQRIAQVIEWNTQIPTDDVKAEVRNGMVTLSGDVDWNFQRTYSHRQIEGIKGVISVTNNIRVRERPAAQDVKQKIEHALHRHADIEASRISLSVKDGTVTLSGNVESFAEKDEIVDAAWSALGVRKVIDNLSIAE